MKNKKTGITANLRFSWNSVLVGFYWNDLVKTLYVYPMPFVVINITFLALFWKAEEKRERRNFEK